MYLSLKACEFRVFHEDGWVIIELEVMFKFLQNRPKIALRSRIIMSIYAEPFGACSRRYLKYPKSEEPLGILPGKVNVA